MTLRRNGSGLRRRCFNETVGTHRALLRFAGRTAFARERNDCRARISSHHFGTVHFFGRLGGYADLESVMNQKPPLVIIDVSNPAAFSGNGSIIVLEYTSVSIWLKS